MLGGLSVRDPFSVLLLEMLELFDSDFFLFFLFTLELQFVVARGPRAYGKYKADSIKAHAGKGENVHHIAADADRGHASNIVAHAD